MCLCANGVRVGVCGMLLERTHGGGATKANGGERRTRQTGTMDKRDRGEDGPRGKNEIKAEIRSKIESAET